MVKQPDSNFIWYNFNSVHKTGLKVQHNNIRGVRPKTSELIEQINSEKPDVISLNETFLKNPKIPRYTWIRKDRTTKGKGGVAFLIKDSLTFDTLENINVKSNTPHQHIQI